MLDGLSRRAIWCFVAALLIGGALIAGFSYWATKEYIARQDAGDRLLKAGGLAPAHRQE
jgi:hypothetical protein